jgi:hypothetical protein
MSASRLLAPAEAALSRIGSAFGRRRRPAAAVAVDDLPAATASDGAATLPTDETEEVRLAMAWNGGVSLAVWMGGVAVELDCARRAHLSPENAGSEETPAPRETYHVLCQTFDRMLVPDIIAGASAGGVNGVWGALTLSGGRRV